MRKVIYANVQNEVLISTYIEFAKEFAEQVSSKQKYSQYLDVLDIILEYHNNYGKGISNNNWYDWIMIIPINLSVMTNGFFAGLETKNNRAKINSYRTLLTSMLEEVVDKIDDMKLEND